QNGAAEYQPEYAGLPARRSLRSRAVNTTSPILWNRLRGHAAQIAMLRRAASRNRLAHGYLFLGPAGVGKRIAARGLAQALFCRETNEQELQPCGQCPACRQVLAQTHPDLLEIGCPEGKRELSIDLIAGAKERRGREGLCHDLSLRPMSADRRVAIIDDAERMNDESANALLKTLEEPPPGSILILLASDLEPILPTIRSRCQPLWFTVLSNDDVAAILQGEGLSAADAAKAAASSGGSLETARKLMESGLAQLKSAVRAGLANPRSSSQALSAQVTEAIEAASSNTAEQRENSAWAIQFAIDHFREILRTGSPDNFESQDRAATSIERCYDALGHLEQSMPVPLCISGLFDDLGKIARTGNTALHSPLLW
ncbi:MAG TPA: DNA polymerase III subunit delta', partial [Caulifigura sp.]|nr:DNA polymerase III subunit delta' [Caulifigura sp.]